MTERTPGLSVLTLVRDRNALLARLIAGLATSTVAPTELVVAWCGGEDPHEVVPDGLPFDVRVLAVGDPSDADVRIPYSPARNAAAGAARSGALAFLDADCIPAAGYVAALSSALADHDALCTGEVHYLPPDPPASFDEPELRRVGRPHPHRERPPADGVALGARHELVWGLHLALRADTFGRIGGFDEGYAGYAGEDTDLAFAARAAGVPVALVAGAEVFHQHHDVWDPPVQQLAATVANATRFRSRWGRWPMEGWLAEFARRGLIAWDPEGTQVAILREPDAHDLAAARRPGALPFQVPDP